MRSYGLMALLAAACGGDNGFSQGNNDPATEAGTGVAEFLPTEIVFPECKPLITNSQFLKVTNVGENTLTVYEVSVIEGGPIFQIEDIAQFTLEPKEEREFIPRATLPDDQPADGTLRVKTSDAEAQDFQIPLHAEPAPPDTGMDDSGK